MFKKYEGDWTDLRTRLKPPPVEVDDYHPDSNEFDGLDYWQRMDRTCKRALEILKQAQEDSETYVMFRHGSSTSRRGRLHTDHKYGD
jgi:hypothetical protein